jgi:hypothetical protein
VSFDEIVDLGHPIAKPRHSFPHARVAGIVREVITKVAIVLRHHGSNHSRYVGIVSPSLPARREGRITWQGEKVADN